MAISMDVLDAARRVAVVHDLPAAVLLAVAIVETSGRAFAEFDGRREPLIRFEGHCFDRLLAGAERAEARAAGLAHPRAGAVRNPSSQAARWRLLERAAAIDADAAHASTSWGLGQVMGVHWRRLGYAGPQAMAAAACESADGQFEIVARFLSLGGLARRLESGDFEGFARAYNGPAFRRNRYDAKIAVAYDSAVRLVGPGADPPAGTRRGDRGAHVAEIQRALSRHGQRLEADGIFGPATEAALLDFQRAAGLPASGVVDETTRESLARPRGLDAGGPADAGWSGASGLLSSLASWLNPLPLMLRGMLSFSTSTARSSGSSTIRTRSRSSRRR